LLQRNILHARIEKGPYLLHQNSTMDGGDPTGTSQVFLTYHTTFILTKYWEFRVI